MGCVVVSECEINLCLIGVFNWVELLSFGVNNVDLVGYVFFDCNCNGVYDYFVDLFCFKVWVIFVNGCIELIDNEGCYYFCNVCE